MSEKKNKSKKGRSKKRGGVVFDSGAEIARQFGEMAITVASPKTRFLITTARITGTGDLDFVKQAIQNQLINDSLEKIRKESDIIVVEKMIAAIVSGKFRDHIEESEETEESSEEEE